VTTPAPSQQRVIALPANVPVDKSLAQAGLVTGRPVVVLIGGAAKLDETTGDLRAAIRDGVMVTAQAAGATVVDGGTDSGVMAIAGQVRRDLNATIPLVGVAPVAKVSAPGVSAARGTTGLEPNHTHVLLAPGDEWGSEAPWLVSTAKILGANRNVVAVLVDGGPLALQEAMACAAQGWPLIVLAGSGRTADVLAEFARGSREGNMSLDRRGSIHVVDLAAGPPALAETLGALLRGQKPAASRPDRTATPARIDYPALYVAASAASKSGQTNFKRLNKLGLALTVGALVVGALASLGIVVVSFREDERNFIDKGVVIVAAAVFLLALLFKLLERSSSYDDDWFHGRAIAETVKSLSWRYMMRVPPFDGRDAEEQMTTELATMLDSAAGIRQAVDQLPAQAEQISPSMREVRERAYGDRRDFYIERRLLEQARWYRQRSARHRRAATRWFWMSVIFQVFAIVAALLALVAVAEAGSSSPRDLETMFLKGMTLAASAAIAVTAWTQLNRDDELAKAYGVSLQELLLIAGAAGRATSDETFTPVVRDGEQAIGRENSVWVAKRSERYESPEFGHLD
jgi:TRPM family ion channel/conflict system pore-forming effector with SLATT domain